MKMQVSVLEEKDYKGKTILFPTDSEIETNDVGLISNSLRKVGVGNTLVRLTNKSFKELKKELIKEKIYERIMVL